MDNDSAPVYTEVLRVDRKGHKILGYVRNVNLLEVDLEVTRGQMLELGDVIIESLEDTIRIYQPFAHQHFMMYKGITDKPTDLVQDLDAFVATANYGIFASVKESTNFIRAKYGRKLNYALKRIEDTLTDF